MRLLPFLKLYECERCGTRILAGKVSMRRLKPVYMQRNASPQFLNTHAGGSSFDFRHQR
jgi:hypothetical protein